MPCLGTPYSEEFSSKRIDKIEHEIKDGVLTVKSFYESRDYQGIGLVDILVLNPDKTMEHYYIITNNGTEDKELKVKDHYDYDCLNGQFLSYDGKVLKEISHHLKEEKISENWLYVEAPKANNYIAFCWDKTTKPMFKDYGLFFDVDFGLVKSGETKTSKPITIAINRFHRYQDLRLFASLKYDIPMKNYYKVEELDDLVLNSGNPFTDKVTAGFKDNSEYPLNGELTLLKNGEKLDSLEVKEEEGKAQVDFSYQEKQTEEVMKFSALYSSIDEEYEKSKISFRKSGGEVQKHKHNQDGFETYTIDNGIARFSCAPQFAPNIFSYQYKSIEQLDTFFPEKKAKAWWNNWFGGIYSLPGIMEFDKYLEEENSCDFTMLTDNLGNNWQGLVITSNIVKNEMYQGLVIRQYYLTLSDSPVVLTFTTQENKCNQHFYYVYTCQHTFFKHDEKTRAFISDDNGRKVRLKTSGEGYRSIWNLPSVELAENRQKLWMYNTSLNKNFTISVGGENLKSEIRWFDSLADNELKVYPHVFFINTELELTEQEVKDLNNIRFDLK